jgi:hypothetical protein
MEKELLAILKSLKSFRKIILGSRINIYTDNKNLIHKTEKFDNKAERWWSLINEFDVKIHHIEGKKTM